MRKEKKLLSKDEMLSYAIRRRRHFEALIYVDNLDSSASKLPELTFSKGTHSSSSDKLITIGVGNFKATSENELFMQIVHMIGIQIQHTKSTVKRDWEAAEKLALKHFCEKLSQDVFGRRGRFLKESDYERFFEELETNGIHMSIHTVRELVTYIAGVLEEGRVERIRTQKKPGFMDYRRVARGTLLLNRPIFPEGVTPIPYDSLNPAEHLKALQQQIAFLATCEKFQRGFLKQYIASPFYDEVKEYIPTIAKAVNATTCKDCMGYAVDILDLMYGRILDAVKYKGGIEQMMKELLEAQANAPDQSQFGASPSDEEKGNGDKPEKLFDDSDLEVTLEDEEYDKLMQQQQNGPQNDDGVNVKRRHDYDEKPPTIPPATSSSSNNNTDENGDENKGGSDGQSEGQDPGTSIPGDMVAPEGSGSSGSSNASGDKGSEETSGSGASGSAGANDTARSEQDSDDAMGSAGDAGSAEETDGEEREDGSSGSGIASEDAEENEEDANTAACCNGDEGEDLEGEESAPDTTETDKKDENTSNNAKDKPRATGPISDTGAASSSVSEDAETENILKAMEAAAKDIQDTDIKSADKAEKYEEEFARKIENFKNKPLTPTDVSGINSKYSSAVNFREMERVYKPDTPLPFALESKGNSLRRKIEEILKNKQMPDRRGMRSGSIDGTRLYKLFQSETTIFKKRGEKSKPDVAGFLLLDNSGSMGNGNGSTRYYACNALSVVEEGFKEFMPLKIAAFDASGSNSVTHEVIKDFEEVAPCNFTHNFYLKGRTGGGNKDGYSIRVATQQLLERPEKDKILMVASDGLPTCYSYGESGVKDVKNAVAEAHANGIKVIGLYMYSYADDHTFQEYHNMYSPDYLMCTMDQIEGELTRIMKRLFTH